MNAADPTAFPRRVLLAVTGLTPQVVTEAVYALAVQGAPRFVPTEVAILTTAEGAERARLTLLSAEPGWFRRLCRDHGLSGIVFDERSIQALGPAGEVALDDIRNADDNAVVADAVTEAVRSYTADPACALHVSMAGGRKTMGFFAGYALSLYGRPQDRLSHVLVEPAFEAHPEFYYPTLESRIIYTQDRQSRPLDTRKAVVTLADIPFVRLRHGLPEALLQGRATFTAAVAAVQQALAPPELVIDTVARQAMAGGIPLPLTPVLFAWLVWFVRRRQEHAEDGGAVHWRDADAQGFLRLYQEIADTDGAGISRVRAALRDGMSQEYFEEKNSRYNKLVRHALGPAAEAYLIRPTGRRPHTRFGLNLPPEAIRIGMAHGQDIGDITTGDGTS
ncbi:MAG: TIGR02584 family CRISPR-associated protein [Rhodospirillales bacterium]|nr:MAG: TIGR02584 family CRISPR-associated protein [Rhodospirillales bacterium]